MPKDICPFGIYTDTAQQGRTAAKPIDCNSGVAPLAARQPPKLFSTDRTTWLRQVRCLSYIVHAETSHYSHVIA